MIANKMDFVYFIDLSSYIGSSEKANGSCICSLSTRNILAFASQNHLYMLPLEKPNELIQLSNNNKTEKMCWSDDGQFLLNVYQDGSCNLFSIKVTNDPRTFSKLLFFYRSLNFFSFKNKRQII